MVENIVDSWREAYQALFSNFNSEADIVEVMSTLIDLIEEEAETRIIDMELDTQLNKYI